MSDTKQSAEEFLFEVALDKGSDLERAAFLDEACREKPELRARIEALLQGHFAGKGFLVAAPKGPAPTVPVRSPEEVPAQTLGQYKLLEKVGEGGFGEVWMAEQRKPVKRRVALKILKLGMDSRQIVARFEAERQALAMMDHPNIAKIHDAGTTETGRPYFVMELVRGVRITDYCDQNQLTTLDRLKLFIKVCQAIQHAHQKGIIHRDIKPSNILVTLHDGVPVPKVIDFGIAKATQQELTDKTVFTQFQQFIGTPAYISPEQAEMSGLDIDTRADIYSLGVLLYELLVGQTPFDAKEIMKGGIDALRKIIREQEPVRPSTKLNTLPGEARTTAGKRRQTDTSKLVHQLQGDLDWIVMKCLEKDRTRRYDTANGLAADIQRHLTDEPVEARAPSAGYKFWKFARRHKTAFTVGAGFTLILVAATVASTWQAFRATRAEALVQKRVLEVAAERDAKDKARLEAEAIAGFLITLFESPDPERKGRSVTVVEVVDRAVKKLDRDLATQPARRAQLQYTLGRTYEALGLDLEAIPLFEKFRDYHLGANGPDHAETLRGMHNLARSYYHVSRNAEALQLQEQYWQGLCKTKGPLHDDTLNAMADLVMFHLRFGRPEQGLRLAEELLPLRRQVNGPLHQKTLAVVGHLAALQLKLGRREDALKMSEELLALRREALGPEHRDTLRAMNTLAGACALNQRTNEALGLYEEVLAHLLKTHRPGQDSLHKSMHVLVLAYARFGRLDSALPLGEELLRLNHQSLGPEHRETLSSMNTLAMIYRRTGRIEEAVRLAASSLELHRRLLGAVSEGALNAMTELATVHQVSGRLEEAIALESEALRLKRQHFPGGNAALIASLENLVTCYERTKRDTEAEALRRELSVLKAGRKNQNAAAEDSPEP